MPQKYLTYYGSPHSPRNQSPTPSYATSGVSIDRGTVPPSWQIKQDSYSPYRDGPPPPANPNPYTSPPADPNINRSRPVNPKPALPAPPTNLGDRIKALNRCIAIFRTDEEPGNRKTEKHRARDYRFETRQDDT